MCFIEFIHLSIPLFSIIISWFYNYGLHIVEPSCKYILPPNPEMF